MNSLFEITKDMNLIVCIDFSSHLQTQCTEASTNSGNGEDLSWNVWFFFAAQLLQGAGAAPLFTLGVTFIDENVSKKMSSVYLGTCYFHIILSLKSDSMN